MASLIRNSVFLVALVIFMSACLFMIRQQCGLFPQIPSCFQCQATREDGLHPDPDILPNRIDDHVQGFSGDSTQLPVHIVHFYHDLPTANTSSLCWLDCLSLASIMLFVQPQRIYFYTNYPDFWPFDTCDMISNWSTVQIVHTRRRFVANGRRLCRKRECITHEADLVKYGMVYKYGGMATDLDVYYLPSFKKLLHKLWDGSGYDCLVTREDTAMNAGFTACHKGADYIRDVLLEYRRDYRTEWAYNSGQVPWYIYGNSSLYQRTVYVDYSMANHLWNHTGSINWHKLPAWHSYFHDRDLDENNVRQLVKTQSFADLLFFILDQARTRLLT